MFMIYSHGIPIFHDIPLYFQDMSHLAIGRSSEFAEIFVPQAQQRRRDLRGVSTKEFARVLQ
jgi:hypothetical protein